MDFQKFYVYSKVPGKYCTETVVRALSACDAILYFLRDNPEHIVTKVMGARR